MNLQLCKSTVNSGSKIAISGSKSETNRLLLLQAYFKGISLQNESNSDDSRLLREALSSTDALINIGHAGTAMRFLTAWFAIQNGRKVILTGSTRMQQRPIGILVEALRRLGAKIDYLENEGFPPLEITGRRLSSNTTSLQANVSSQYISALLLIAPSLENGIEVTLEGEVTSMPYIEMTLQLLQKLNIKTSWQNNVVRVASAKNAFQRCDFLVESDWSSASYYYSMIALSPIGTTIILGTFYHESLQGDRALAEIYSQFGVSTKFHQGNITLTKTHLHNDEVYFNLNDSPDLAQTIAVTSLGLRCTCKLSGLKTLKIKETDRLAALQIEISKLGGNIHITDDSLSLEKLTFILANQRIATYNDHRMAMAFAPLALVTNIVIENADVVSKSYPEFWWHLREIGIRYNEL